MVLMIAAHSVVNGNGKTVPLDVPDSKVPSYLARGWSLAEGESYTPPTVKGKRVLEVDPAIVGSISGGSGADLTKVGEGTSDEDNTDEGDQSDDDSDEDDSDDSNSDARLPGLSGLSKEALLDIAKAEGVDVNPDANKIVIKSAIEAARAASK